MNPMLNIAIRAARRAGNVIAKNYERRDDIQTSKKGINDYVTSVDKAAEAEIIEKGLKWISDIELTALLVIRNRFLHHH